MIHARNYNSDLLIFAFILDQWHAVYVYLSQNSFICHLCPDPQNTENLLNASFVALENNYNEEKNSIVKTVPKLKSKALYPTSTEKQNVNLALKMFDKSNFVALKLHSKQFNNASCITTATFIDEICKWRKIRLIKHSEKGFNKSLDDALPFIYKDNRLQSNNNKYKVIISFLYLFNFRPEA